MQYSSKIHLYGHVLRKALDFEVEDQKKVEEESVMVGLRR